MDFDEYGQAYSRVAMKPDSSFQANVRQFASAHLIGAIIVLVMTIAASITGEAPIRSLIPYGASVALVAWRHGMSSGFLFAGLATLAALAAGAFPTRPEFGGEEIVEGLYAYFKLSAISFGVAMGKRSSLGS